jgi:tellurite resistance protein
MTAPPPQTLLDLVALHIGSPGAGAPAGVTTSILARSAMSYGFRSEQDDLTVPSGFDPVAAALFEAVVEAAFLVANADNEFDDTEKAAFRSVVITACDNAVDERQIDALLADLTELLAEDGIHKRVQMVAKAVNQPLQRAEVLRIAALMAHISGGVSQPERSVLEQLASRFSLPGSAVDEALAQARAALKIA